MAALQQTAQSMQYDRDATPSVTKVAFSFMCQWNSEIHSCCITLNLSFLQS